MARQSRKVSVLLVDDNEIDVMAVRRSFGKHRLDNAIVTAVDGREALEKLRDGQSIRPPYIVLLDLNMPRMNGFEFLAEARCDPALRASVVFVMTTSGREEDRARAYAHSVAGYIVKDGDGYAEAASLFRQYLDVVELP
jgi:CheY-like chemotaxis protein